MKANSILDCFCGRGSTISVACKFNRKFIGIDQSVQSIKVTQARLEKEKFYLAMRRLLLKW
jgi:adenine-specific DNA-methyltransferase